MTECRFEPARRRTFARNQMARAFYERHGFVAVAHGFEPMWQLDDVKYQWERP